MGYIFICLQCGYREEAVLKTGRVCPACGRARLVAYQQGLVKVPRALKLKRVKIYSAY